VTIGAGWHDVVRPMAEALSGDLRTAAVELCRRAGETIPEVYQPDVFAAAVDSAESNIHMMLSMMREGLDPAAVAFPPASGAFARHCARAGMSVETLVRIGHVGAALLWHDWLADMRERATDATVLVDAMGLVHEFLFAYMDSLYAHWATEYVAERDRWLRSRAAARAEVVQALLDGRGPDQRAGSERLGYDLSRTHRAFVVWSSAGDDPLDGLERHAAGIAAELSSEEPLLVPRGPSLVAGWVATEPDRAVPTANVRRRLSARPARGEVAAAHVAFGSARSGLDGFRRSHLEAVEAARVAGLGERRPAAVTEYDDVALVALSTVDLEQARRFVEAELGPLAGDDDATLRLAATVRTYLHEHFSPKRTASRLGIHENTVAYRVRQAEQLLGRPVDERRLELEVALLLSGVIRRGRHQPGS
jgi:hypothetical protein